MPIGIFFANSFHVFVFAKEFYEYFLIEKKENEKDRERDTIEMYCRFEGRR